MPSITGRLLEWIRRKNDYQFPRVGPLGFRLARSIFPDRIDSELFPGLFIELNLHDKTQLATYWHGTRFEHPTASILADWCKDASVFFDIGSNYGFYTYCLYTRCPSLEMYAFEPNPLTYEIVRKTKERNAMARFHPFQMGLSDKPAILDLHPGTDDSGQSTFGPLPEFAKRSIAKVEVLPFDEFCLREKLNFPPRPAWVAKIDVEGFDLKVLHGMKRALTAKAFKGLSVEMNESNLSYCEASTTAIREFLREHGYRTKFPPFSDGNIKTDNEFFVPID